MSSDLGDLNRDLTNTMRSEERHRETMKVLYGISDNITRLAQLMSIDRDERKASEVEELEDNRVLCHNDVIDNFRKVFADMEGEALASVWNSLMGDNELEYHGDGMYILKDS